MNQYETVFILTPVLSDDQMKETVEKFKGVLTNAGAEIISEENALELFYRFLHLFIRQNGSQNENGFVLVHNTLNKLINNVLC